MSRAILDDPQSGTPTRIGRGSIRTMALVVAGLSVGIAFFIAAPVTQFGPILIGAPVPWFVGYLVSVGVVAVLIGPLLLPRATRPVYVDATGGHVRVGLRSRPVGDIQRAYRLPDGLSDGRFQLRLALPGIDALVGVSARMPAELSTAEFNALIALVERAPIEPDPGVTLRPPLGDELGPRDAAQSFSDDINRSLLAHETMSFAKPTLLAELRGMRDVLAGTGTGVGTATIRDIGLVVPYTTNAPVQQADLAEANAIAAEGPKRGLFWTLSRAFRADAAARESWLEPVGAPQVGRVGVFSQRLGIAVIVAGLAAPWLAVIPFFVSVFIGNLFGAPDLGALGGIIAFFMLTWPFIVWAGIIVNWRGRVQRFESIRRRAVAARATGITAPVELAAFVGPRFADVAYLNQLLWFLIVQSIVLLAGGLTMFAVAMGQVENWGPSAIGAILGVLMAVASIPVFAAAVQLIARFGTRTLRAVAYWRAIASPLG